MKSPKEPGENKRPKVAGAAFGPILRAVDTAPCGRLTKCLTDTASWLYRWVTPPPPGGTGHDTAERGVDLEPDLQSKPRPRPDLRPLLDPGAGKPGRGRRPRPEVQQPPANNQIQLRPLHTS